MPFDWLNDFHRGMEKADNYADKTLAAYKLGIKAGGAICGVSVCAPPTAAARPSCFPKGRCTSPTRRRGCRWRAARWVAAARASTGRS